MSISTIEDVQGICTEEQVLKQTEGFHGLTFDECALTAKNKEGVHVFKYQKYPTSDNKGFCQYYDGKPELYRPEKNTGECSTYLVNRQIPNSLFNDKTAITPTSRRSFTIIDPTKGLEDCKNACINPYNSDCTHFYVENNKCNLLYGRNENNLYSFGSSIGLPAKTPFCSPDQAPIDNRDQCRQAASEIQNYLNQKFKEDNVDASKKVNVVYKAETNNKNLPFGCIFHHNNTKTKSDLQVYFNSEKSHNVPKNNNDYYNICTSHPQNKVVLDKFSSNNCRRGKRILDEKQCELLGDAIFFKEYKGLYKGEKGKAPHGCIAVTGENKDNQYETSIYFNPDKNNDDAKNKNVAPVCDLYPNILSEDFKSDYWENDKVEGVVVSGKYVDLVRKQNLQPSSRLLFTNDTTTVCENKQKLIRRVTKTLKNSKDKRWNALSCVQLCKDDPECKSFLFTEVAEFPSGSSKLDYSGVCDLYSTRCEGNAAVSSKQLSDTGLRVGMMNAKTTNICTQNDKTDKGNNCLGNVVSQPESIPFSVFSDINTVETNPLYGRIKSKLTANESRLSYMAKNNDVIAIYKQPQSWRTQNLKDRNKQILIDLQNGTMANDFELPSMYPLLENDQKPDPNKYDVSKGPIRTTRQIENAIGPIYNIFFELGFYGPNNNYQRLRSYQTGDRLYMYKDNKYHYYSAKPYVRVNMDESS